MPGYIQPRTLLLVDDEPYVRSSLVRLLRRSGHEYRVFTAASGQEGLELLSQHEIGVILSDQRMPEMTGVEFPRRVKTLHPKTIRIVLSGYTDLQSVTDAINEGAIYKFLTKPWDDVLLCANIEEAFERHETVLENERLQAELTRVNSRLESDNLDLERRVAEKTREIVNNINVLQVSQEILEYLPLAVIGADADGLIVVVNRQADELFAAPPESTLLGSYAAERLPKTLLDRISETAGSSCKTRVNFQLPDGRHAELWWHRMGAHCKSAGIVLVVSPWEESDDGAR